MFERFMELMKEHGKKFSDISRETGIPYSTFTDWKAGRYTPKADKLQKIANYFNVPLDYLLTGQVAYTQYEIFVSRVLALGYELWDDENPDNYYMDKNNYGGDFDWENRSPEDTVTICKRNHRDGFTFERSIRIKDIRKYIVYDLEEFQEAILSDSVKVTQAESELLRLFRTLPDAKRSEVIQYCKFLASEAKREKKKDTASSKEA